MMKIRTYSHSVAKAFFLAIVCCTMMMSTGCSMFEIDNDPLKNHSYMKEEVGYFPQSGKFRDLKEAEKASAAKIEKKNNLLTPTE
jgi:hypothetical protein